MVDVRDVANAHFLAMSKEEAAGNRFILVSSYIWTKDMAAILKENFESRGIAPSSHNLPWFIVWLGSWFNSKLAYTLRNWGKE